MSMSTDPSRNEPARANLSHIRTGDGLFRLATRNTSLWLRVTSHGHLEQLHYGERLHPNQPVEALAVKRTAMAGTSVAYREEDPLYCLDTLPLAWSGIGCGDYRHAPAELKMPDGTFSNDFLYVRHVLHEGCVPMTALPSAVMGSDPTTSETGSDPTAAEVGSDPASTGAQTLEIEMREAVHAVTLRLYFTVFPETDVITRRVVLENHADKPLAIRRLMSLMMELPNLGFKLVSFDGGWIKEAHRHERPVSPGMHVLSSTTGNSSNRHNPGFLLAETTATEAHGRVYGFNLVYSGNHYSAVELSNGELVRVQTGINPHCFEWQLEPGDRFETPEAVMTFSHNGFTGLSRQFHDFVNRHIVRGDWQNRERPVLLNNWEAHFFKFNRAKLLRLARRAKTLGVELFVLDDGWFGKRNSDNAGLGDYTVNRRKLPGGLVPFARRIRRMGLAFGLWFEPEMVNPDSDLYRAHPEYAVTIPGRKPTLGRNQLVLDLCNPAVRDYLVAQIGTILDEAGIQYVKWDMNRHISDMYSPVLAHQGEFPHRYILGLYDVLTRLFRPRPHILLESCASGGNRFDLGMLCFSPQIWTSDDTDPGERLAIQGGLSHLYPLSTMGAHVSEAPHQQTLRDTPLPTRFNVAAFGCLGYELDLKWLSYVEKREIRRQIAFYKQHRRTLQYGRFRRHDRKRANQLSWQCTAQDGSEAVAGFFQTRAHAAEGTDMLPLADLDSSVPYRVETRPQPVFIKRFGGLVKHLLPVELNPSGFLLRMANRFHALTDSVERYEARGDLLQTGVRLNSAFIGSYYNDKTRLLGDFGSNLYVVTRQEP